MTIDSNIDSNSRQCTLSELNARCQICGDLFQVYPSELDSRKYCSYSCYWVTLSKGNMVTCKECGKEFQVSPSQIARGRKFCSSTCFHLSEKQSYKVICKYCGKEFVDARHNVTRQRQFCGRACANAFRKGSVTSAETKEKMSESQRRRYLEQPDAREKLSASLKGHIISEATKAKIREARLRNIVEYPDAIQNTGIMNRGRMLPEWHRERVRQAHLGKKLTTVHKESIRKAALQYVASHNEDTRFIKKGTLSICHYCGRFIYSTQSASRKFCSIECYNKSPERILACQKGRESRKLEIPSKIQRHLFECLKDYGAVPEYLVNEGIRTYIDIAFPKSKVAVYVDGTYWHSLPGCRERDERQNKRLCQLGWKVFRFTDKDVRIQLNEVLSFIISAGALAPIKEVGMLQ